MCVALQRRHTCRCGGVDHVGLAAAPARQLAYACRGCARNVDPVLVASDEPLGEMTAQTSIAHRRAVDDGDSAFEAVLTVAHEWRADLIVMGRSDKRRLGGHYVRSQTEHLLEFTDIPVLVVPEPPSHDARSQPGSGS